MNSHDLIQRHLDGLNSTAEAAQLSVLLEMDPAARDRYFVIAGLHAALAADETLRAPRKKRVIAKPKWTWVAPALKIAASMTLAALVFWWLKPASGLNLPFATLVSTVNERWENGAMELSLNAGEEPSGLLHLLEGQAEFSTSRGASVALEAPAVMRFESATAIFVKSGKVLCRCPTPESRLTVRTPETQVIDLGTEFAVEARGDSSTRVAVFSGEVKVASTVLHEGQGAEVRTKGVTMLDAAVVREMMARMADEVMVAGETNRLRNAGFDSLAECGWKLAENHAMIEDGALCVSSRGHRFWPGVSQPSWQSDLNGHAVVASVSAMQPGDDPLQPMQFAVLKLVFMGEGGRPFAYASRHFQFGGEPTGVFETAHVAAIAPLGTKGVSVELLLNARGEKSGSVIFDDAVLHIGPLKTSKASSSK